MVWKMNKILSKTEKQHKKEKFKLRIIVSRILQSLSTGAVYRSTSGLCSPELLLRLQIQM